MPDQLGANFTVDWKVESVYNTAPGDTGATRMRLLDSPGMNTRMTEIKSGERRGDLLDTIARMGSRESAGSFNCEMIVGAHDLFYEAAMRGTWTAAQAITSDGGAAITSFEVLSTSTFQFAGTTTPIAAGLNVGDAFRFTNMSNALNNGKNIVVKSISGSIVTVIGTPLTVQAADAAATITILKKLSNPATPVRRTFYCEQRFVDVDGSLLFGGTRFLGFNITGAPDGMASVSFPVLGGAPAVVVTGASSPYYTSPTLPAGSPLTFADCVLAYNGTVVAKATAFSLNYQIAASTLKIIGGNTSPDVYDSKATLSGSISLARSDLARIASYLAEDTLELHILLVEPESEPKDCIALYVPQFKLTTVDAQLGGDGAMVEACNWTAGVKDGAAATGFDQTLLTILTSAA